MPAFQLAKHMANVIDDAGCLVWQGSHSNGHPAARIDGKNTLLRRAVWAHERGAIPPGLIVHMTCGTPSCICSECMELVTRAQMAKINGANGVNSGHARSAAIARVKRAGPQAKLTPLAVADIRASGDSQRVLSVRWGVSQAHVSKVQKHKAYRDFSSPFAGLGARA